MAIYTVTNLTGGDASFSGLFIEKGGKRGVDIISKSLQKAKDAGKVSISPDPGSDSNSKITSAFGTAINTGALADVTSSFSQTILNNNFKTIVDELTRLSRRQANVEARLGKLNIYQN